MALLPRHPSDRLATAVLLFSATLWGLTWMPLKAFVGQGLTGPVVSLLTYGSVGLLAVVMLWRDRAAPFVVLPLHVWLEIAGRSARRAEPDADADRRARRIANDRGPARRADHQLQIAVAVEDDGRSHR